MSERFDLEYPKELEAAPSEFVEWSQSQLAQEQVASTPKTPLYHYTGEDAFKGILQNEKFWCFSHEHQQDPNEFSFSLCVARRVLQELRDSTSGCEHHIYACIDDLLEKNNLNGVFEFYLASFSRHRDDPGQWKNYGREGKGFAIGLAPVLFHAGEVNLKPNANENVFVGRVLYGEGDTEARHRLAVTTAAKIADSFAKANPEKIKMVRPSLYVVTMAREVIANQLIWNCLTAKETKFAIEEEVRFVLMGVCKKFDSYRKNHNGRLYVETPVALKIPGNISEIIIGPNASEDAENFVSDFLQSNGYPKDIPIVRSKAKL